MKCPEFNLTGRGFFSSFVADSEKSSSPLQKMSEYYIELHTEEYGGFCSINGTQYSLKKGTLICSKPEQYRCTTYPACCFYIHLQTQNPALLEFLNSFPDACNLIDISSLLPTFRKLAAMSWKDDIVIILTAQSLVSALLADISEQLTKQKRLRLNLISPNHHPVMFDIENYIRSNISADLSLNTLASRANFSPTYLSSLWREFYDQTLHEFILSCRIQHAKSVLRSEDCNMAKLAFDCGFSSQSHFCSQFKKATGQTPLQYRKSKIGRHML